MADFRNHPEYPNWVWLRPDGSEKKKQENGRLLVIKNEEGIPKLLVVLMDVGILKEPFDWVVPRCDSNGSPEYCFPISNHQPRLLCTSVRSDPGDKKIRVYSYFVADGNLEVALGDMSEWDPFVEWRWFSLDELTAMLSQGIEMCKMNQTASTLCAKIFPEPVNKLLTPRG